MLASILIIKRIALKVKFDFLLSDYLHYLLSIFWRRGGGGGGGGVPDICVQYEKLE